MQIHYSSDGEQSGAMALDSLIKNFRTNEVKFYEDDIRNELDSRGWYEGTHECGRYLVLNLAMLGLKTA